MDILIQAGQLILSLSILVVLHELGHFIPARLFGTRVEKFYLFFNPWFSVFKVKKGETEYGLGWLPLGGYVKIAGMIDESMDKDQMTQPAQPWEFRAKPAWQRLIIMLGGVTVNFILGYFIFIMVLWVWGKEYLPVDNAHYGMFVSNDALRGENLLMDGDKLLTVGGKKPLTYQEAGKLIVINGDRTIQVEREGQPVTVHLPQDVDQDILNAGKGAILEPRLPFVIAKVKDGMPAQTAGIQPGDSIVGVDEMDQPYFQNITKYFSEHKSEAVLIHVYRNGKPVSVQTTLDENGKIGAESVSPARYFKFQTESFSFFQAIPAGISEASSTLSNYVKSLALIFTPAGVSQIGGFAAIGSAFSPSWDWHSFWTFTAFLSLMLAFMNLLPIPALDGGHVLFLLYEIIRGKAPGQRFMEIAQLTGMVLLLGLILFANGNDIKRIFFN